MLDSECLVLRQMDFRERDKIITFLTKNDGKKSGIVYGVKHLRSRKVAHTELFNHIHIIYQERSQQELVTIKKCELIKSSYLLSQNYQKYLYASYFTELFLITLIPPDESSLYFNLLLTHYTRLEQEDSHALVKLSFEYNLLKLMGLLPNLENCMKCQQSLWQQGGLTLPRSSFKGRLLLDSRLGGMQCPQCSVPHPDASWLSSGTLSYLYLTLYKNSQREVGNVKVTSQILTQLNQAFHIYFRYHLGKASKSHTLLKIG